MGEGGLAPWPSPKPVSLQHLETIIGTIIVVQTWLPGPAAVHSESRGMGQSHLLPPPPHQCLPWHQHVWLPVGSVVGNSQPELQTWSLMVRVGAPEPGQKSGGPSSTPYPACHLYGLQLSFSGPRFLCRVYQSWPGCFLCSSMCSMCLTTNYQLSSVSQW